MLNPPTEKKNKKTTKTTTSYEQLLQNLLVGTRRNLSCQEAPNFAKNIHTEIPFTQVMNN